jgi:hypothetical protein
MGVYYSLRLCVGFELTENEAKAPFVRKTEQKIDGSFHMEDRFDPKTGAKLEPIKVWDRKPKTITDRWYEIDGQKYDDGFYDDKFVKDLKVKLGCHIEMFGSLPSGDITFAFYLNKPSDTHYETGKYTMYNDHISIDELMDILPKLHLLKERMEKYGYKPSEPRVFIAQLAG